MIRTDATTRSRWSHIADAVRLEPHPEGDAHLLTRALLVRALGLVHVVAFASLWLQLEGLIGRNGILPAIEAAVSIEQSLGLGRYFVFPSVYWIWPADVMLPILCAVGVAAGLMVVAGLLQGPLLVLLWACYLSLMTLAPPFLTYQWDLLLLEATATALLIAPWRPWAPEAPEPSPLGVTMFRVLLWKVLFFGGLTKLVSGEPLWRDLSALSTHLWTQPLPTPVSQLLLALPGPLLMIAAGLALAVELLAAWTPLLGRRARAVGFLSVVIYMAVNNLAGNVGFYPMLTAVVAIGLLDDELLAPRLPPWLASLLVPEEVPAVPAGRRAVQVGRFAIGFGATVMLTLSALRIIGLTAGIDALPAMGKNAILRTYHFRTVNTYGLFSRIALARTDVSFEGTLDGETWIPYPTRVKPTAATDRPRFVAPHHPRLDWQLAQVGRQSCAENSWLLRVSQGLLVGSAPIEGLFAGDPFGDGLPDAVRVVRRPITRAGPGEAAYWTLGPAEEFCPAQTRDE